MSSYSLVLFGYPVEQLGPLTLHAEEEGWGTVWVSEHVVWPVAPKSAYPYASESPYSTETPLADPWVTIGNLAARTERIRLSTGVLIAPLRHPLMTARAAQTAQQLAPGRIALAIGAGWLEQEYDLLGVDFRTRGIAMDEVCEVLRTAWGTKPIDHHGEVWDFAAADLGPRPAEPPPLYLGGLAAPALRRCARLADGWVGTATPLATAERVRERIEAERGRIGATRPFSYWPRLESMEVDLIREHAAAGFDDLTIHLRDLVPTDAPLRLAKDAISAAAEVFRAGQGG